MNPDTPVSLPNRVNFGCCHMDLDSCVTAAVLEAGDRMTDNMSSVPSEEVSACLLHQFWFQCMEFQFGDIVVEHCLFIVK